MSGIAPFRVLRAKPLWIANGVITGVLALLFAVFYVGANIDPAGHMKELPVGLVNADKGAAVGGKQVNLGARITGSAKKSTASGDKIDWKVMDEREMREELGKGKLFGALVVPADFTSSATALTGTAPTETPVRPTLTVLTNQSGGSLGSGLARTATTQAAENASLQVGKALTAQIGTAQAKLPAAARVLLTDPAAVTVKDGHPLDSHSGLGLTAFYYALTLVVGIMGMDATHLPLLWLYSVCAIAVTGIGALTLLAVFGTPGMLMVTLVFIGMAVPTSGATTPIEALPGFYRFLAEFEPLRQITGGIRSILYYDAQGDAGLTRGWLMMAAGLTAAALFGFGVLGWYDRKGLHRIPAEMTPDKTAVPA
jgi:YhgE/Pip-like protein